MKKLQRGEVANFFVNPFYDDIIIFRDNIPTSQDRYKPIDLEKGLFQLIEHNAITEFKKNLKERLQKKLKPMWPYKDDLYVAFELTGF
jgi:hypothetical protein